MPVQNQTGNSGESAPLPPPYDEAQREDGGHREHWQYLLDALQEMGAPELDQRRRMLERVLRDDGATYNDYSAGLEARAWTLDPIPLLIDSQEWSHIEAGVRERAELLNLVLRDLYGPRTLLRHGIIPPELILSHQGFLRECQDLFLPGEQQLIQYAADMTRCPDGVMRVISDRAQAPSGTGYALENRQAMTRVFPSLFRDSHVHRLSLYFNSLRQKLAELNPNDDVARVAILTPGAYNETYFEHVHLANFLGYQLVQGNDLTVRDGCVWLKTLGGLSRIDVILRRVDDAYCDPVELKADSRLGVPGLLEAMRLGNVAVVNPPGSGILENRGLLRYLPAAARHFLGRELSLECIPTWWCGDPGDRDHVLANLDSLVIKTTFRGSDSRAMVGHALSASEREDLRQAILAQPLHYVAQELVQHSTSPVWQNGDTCPLPLVLRSFAVAGESSYTVMPGGLTRVGTRPGQFEISNRRGSLSKDTWVLASEPEKRVDLDATPPALRARQGRAELSSRVVENLFWFGRYAERAEAALRLLRTVFVRLHGETPLDPQSRSLLLRAVTQLTGTYPGFMDQAVLDAPAEDELLSVVLDQGRYGSVMFSLHALLDAVDQVKDYLSADTQRIVNDLFDEMASLESQLRGGYGSAPEEELDSVVTTLLALAGLAQESLVRDQGWHFLDLGRRLERAQQTCSLLRSLWVPVIFGDGEYQLLESALHSSEALTSYRRRFNGDLNIVNGLDMMLLEADNPRALTYQLDRLQEHLAALPRLSDPGHLSSLERLLLEASSMLRLAEPQVLAQVKRGQYLRVELDQLLARIQRLVSELGDALGGTYFDHSAGAQPMAPFSPDRPT